MTSVLTEPCFYCEGRGTLKSKNTVCYELFRDLERECTGSERQGNAYVLVNPEVDTVLREDEQESVIELEKRLGKRITIVPKKDFHMEQYEISI